MVGPDPIQPDQIEGWMRLNGIELTAPEINLLLGIDMLYRVELMKEQERNKPPPTQSNRPLPRGGRYNG